MARGSDDTGDTALHRAAEIGDLEMMEELIAAGAAVDAARADGFRPVHCALHRGRMVRLTPAALESRPHALSVSELRRQVDRVFGSVLQ